MSGRQWPRRASARRRPRRTGHSPQVAARARPIIRFGSGLDASTRASSSRLRPRLSDVRVHTGSRPTRQHAPSTRWPTRAACTSSSAGASPRKRPADKSSSPRADARRSQDGAAAGAIHRKPTRSRSRTTGHTWLDLTDASWTPADDYVLHIQSDKQLYVVPSQDSCSSTTGEREARSGAATRCTACRRSARRPRAGEDGSRRRHLVRAGGAPATLLPGSLAALRARMGITRITHIVLIHVHSITCGT